ncbi:hypothetical protein NKE62_06550 [Akkermansia sp. Marseille-P9185]|nr:hypothetical protein [Akkermansia massiliensis]
MNLKNLIHHWPLILLILFIIIIFYNLIFPYDLSKWIKGIINAITVVSLYIKQYSEQRNAKHLNSQIDILKKQATTAESALAVSIKQLNEKKKQSYNSEIKNINQELENIDVDISTPYYCEHSKGKKAFEKIYNTFLSLNETIYFISKSIEIGLPGPSINQNKNNFLLSKRYYEELIPITSQCNKLLQDIDTDGSIDEETKESLIKLFFSKLSGHQVIVLNLMSHILDYGKVMPVIEEKYMQWGCKHFPQRFKDPLDYGLWRLMMKKTENKINEEIQEQAVSNFPLSSS